MDNKIRHNWIAWSFLAPALIFVIIFIVVPFIGAFKLSLYSTNGLGLSQFIGLNNFINMFKDPLFYHSLIVLLIYIAIAVPIQVFMPFFGAKMIFSLRSSKLAYLFRILLVFPVVVPGAAIWLIWMKMYQPGFTIDNFLSHLGFGKIAISWLGNPHTALYALIFISIPFIGGINMLLYLAGYMNIPKDLYENADLAGASTCQKMWHIEWPLLMPMARLSFILSIVGLVSGYGIFQVMTTGGPGNATLVTQYYMFQNAFLFGKVGYGTTIGVFLFVILIIISYFGFRLTRRRDV